MLHAVTIGGLGPATAFPATLIEGMTSTETRLICVLKPVMEVRTYFAGAVPGLKGLRVEEYSVVNANPPFTALRNSGYCVRFSVNTLPAAAVALEVDADWSNTLAAASAAASNAPCRRDLLSSTCAVSSARPAMAIARRG